MTLFAASAVLAQCRIFRGRRDQRIGTQQPLPLMSGTKGIDCCKPKKKNRRPRYKDAGAITSAYTISIMASH